MIIVKKTEEHPILHLPLHKKSILSAICTPEYQYPRFIKNLDYYLGEKASQFDELTPELAVALKESGYQVCKECEKLVQEYVENKKKWDKEKKQKL